MSTFPKSGRAAVGRKLWAIAGCLAALAAAAALDPSPKVAGSEGSVALRALVALGALCGLAWWLLRRTAGGRLLGEGAPAPLRVVGRASLSQRNGLALVEADGRRLLVAYGDGFTRILPLARDAYEETSP